MKNTLENDDLHFRARRTQMPILFSSHLLFYSHSYIQNIFHEQQNEWNQTKSVVYTRGYINILWDREIKRDKCYDIIRSKEKGGQ